MRRCLYSTNCMQLHVKCYMLSCDQHLVIATLAMLTTRNIGDCRTDAWLHLPRWALAVWDLYMRVAFLTPDQGSITPVYAAIAPLQDVTDSSGSVYLYLQPYWNAIDIRPLQALGPF